MLTTVPGQHPILGTILFSFGLLLIAWNKKTARQFEALQSLSRTWDMNDYPYTVWRLLIIVLGSILVFVGASMLLILM